MVSSSSSSFTHNLPRALFPQCPRTQRETTRRLLFFSCGFFSQKELDRGRLVVAGAKKRKDKPDSHSFVAKPDEATGPFPESVLLKKKSVKEDGQDLPEFADAEEEKLFEFLSLQLESDLDVERMRHYEVVYLIHEDRVDEVESVVTKVQDFVREKKGRIWRLNDWGLRRLAYKIKKATHANYILMNFELEAKFINDFKSLLDKDERIIRHLVMKQDKAITEDCPPPPEFHSVLAQQEMIDEEGDDDDAVGVDEDWDDEAELEMAGYDDANAGDDGDGANIIIVDEYDSEDSVTRSGRTIKAEKVAR
ncbi:protein REGULATOR OF FATTY ACID COMPOSITION 3, chloroplastic [Typha angustifolia]|uniref:protein REGULATOR OF FATTY ACID COMPOSITION 3, chloroplastic n=1 Tax=Typha angustifolia TaxID=59011 RepID=UPI003C2CF901